MSDDERKEIEKVVKELTKICQELWTKEEKKGNITQEDLKE